METGFERLRKCTREELESKPTSELEWHYIDAYKEAISSGKLYSDPRLKTVTRVLFKRKDREGKREIRAQIHMRLEEAVAKRDFDNSVVYRNMLDHYENYVMARRYQPIETI